MDLSKILDSLGSKLLTKIPFEINLANIQGSVGLCIESEGEYQCFVKSFRFLMFNN